jgi:hypothetical protein
LVIGVELVAEILLVHQRRVVFDLHMGVDILGDLQRHTSSFPTTTMIRRRPAGQVFPKAAQ